MFKNIMEFIKNVLSCLWVTSFVLFFSPSLALDPNCDYSQYLNPGVTYYVYNQEYPKNYWGSRECRWVAKADPGYKISLICDLEIPNSQSCYLDRLLVSTNGNINLVNSTTYCGTGRLTIQSDSNRLAVGFQSVRGTPGGRFLCNMTTIKPCECGWKNTRRIVGGKETGVNEFPSMAGLVDFAIREVYCGATIIAYKYALTAAHCVENKQATAIGLLVGDHNLASGQETHTAKLIVIERIIKHYQYDPVTMLNDIAIVVTRDTITYSSAVGPACLPFQYFSQPFTGQSVELLGWGTTEFTGPKSDVLLKTTVQVVSPYDCSSQAQGVASQICTFAKGDDSCQADSGGPLLWLNPDTHRVVLVGIISSGSGCATNVPSLNTRVTSYLQWITTNTPDAQYCVPNL